MVLILDLAATLLVMCPPLLLVLVMDLLLRLSLVILSLVVLGEILLNGPLVINLVVAFVDDMRFVIACPDTPQHLLTIVNPIQIINLATSIVPNQNLRMEVIHFQLIVAITIKMIAVILDQLVATLPTVTEEMAVVITHHLPLKIVKVVYLHKLNHSLILIISLNVWVLNPMKKKNAIIRPVDSNANGICGLNV
jgi:hypothetical protein